MTRLIPFVFVLACSSSATPVEPDAPPRPLHFTVHSTFDVASNMPGDVGRAANVLFDATDDPDDPARFLVDLVIDQMPDGTAKNIARATAPYLAGYLNGRLTTIAPELLLRLVTVGRELGEAARHLGTVETLAVAPDGTTATHALTGVRYTLDNIAVELPFATYGLTEPAASAMITSSPGALGIGPHTLSLSYGKLLRMTLDHAIVPRVDPGAVDLLGLFQNAVDCSAVGAALASGIGVGNPDDYAHMCRDGLTLAATAIYDDLAHVDAQQLTFDLAGAARVEDVASGQLLVDGTWTGTLTYGPLQAPLGEATFTGARD